MEKSIHNRISSKISFTVAVMLVLILSTGCGRAFAPKQELSEIREELHDAFYDSAGIDEELHKHVDDGVPMDPGLVFKKYDDADEHLIRKYEGRDVVVCVGYTGENTEVRIPNTFNGMPVVGIYSEAYQGFNSFGSLVSLEIPDSVTIINGSVYGVFGGCNLLENIVLSANLETIPDGAFSGCSSLKSIVIPDGVSAIGAGAFQDCKSLTSVTIPNSVLSIGPRAFSDCFSLTDVNKQNGVVLPENLIKIGSRAFLRCPLAGTLTIPDSVITKPGDLDNNFEDAFFGCQLSEIIIGKGMESVKGFGGNPLESITIPDWVKAIEKNAFAFSALSEIVIPDSVEYIGISAFEYCESLKSVTFPSSFMQTGDDALYIYDYAFCYVPLDPLLAQKIQFVNPQAWEMHEVSGRKISHIRDLPLGSEYDEDYNKLWQGVLDNEADEFYLDEDR